MTAGLTAIVLPLVEGRQHGWPEWTLVSLALAPVILGGFVIQQRRLADRGGSPLLELSLFSQRTFSAGLLAQLVFGAASVVLPGAGPVSPARAWAQCTPCRTGIHDSRGVVPGGIAGRTGAAQRHGRRVLAAGALVLACGHGLLLAAVGRCRHRRLGAGVVPGLLLIGAGMGLGIAPLATIIMSGMKPEHAGAASGALSTMQNVGNALGVAIIGVIFFGALHSLALPTRSSSASWHLPRS